ncbi:MAG: hypothetical protein JST00_26495 [Deltaproteobacteria bacterium]|nr:hypothetical protein [Deltaproteobacteria bacterium]
MLSLNALTDRPAKSASLAALCVLAAYTAISPQPSFRGLVDATLIGGTLSLALILLFLRARVSLGIDGLMVSKPFARPEHHPFSTILEATMAPNEVITLSLRGGRKLVLHCPVFLGASGFFAFPSRRARDGRERGARALFERIHTQLQRKNRRTDETVAAVGGWRFPPAPEGASYRELSVATEVLWRVVEDPLTDTTTREQAARALYSRIDADEDMQRLRDIAEACVDPAIRTSLGRR